MTPIRPKYGQTALYLALLIMVFIAMSMTRRCSSSAPLPALLQGNSKGDTVDVAILYGPTSYYLYGDSLGGINYDMLRLFGKESGTPVKFWPVVNLHDALNRLENGTYSMLASLPSDNSVKRRFLTTNSVFLDRLVLIQLADTNGTVPINSALGLAGDTVHIPLDSPAASRLSNLSDEIGDTIFIRMEKEMSEEYLCMMVSTGKMRLAVVNEKTAVRMQREYPYLSYDNPVSFTQFQVWLMNKSDTALLHKTDRWLENFQQTERYKNIINKY